MGSLRDVEQVREQDAVQLPFLVAGPLAKDLLALVLYILGMSRAMIEPATLTLQTDAFTTELSR